MKVVLVTLTRGRISGGYLKYLNELVPRLRGHRGVSELHVYVPPATNRPEWRARSWPESGLFGAVRWLRNEIATLKPDVVFIPSSVFFDAGPLPVVVMLRNMEPIDSPFHGNSWRERLVNIARSMLARSACKRASRVIAVSEYVRERLVTTWGINAGKVGVVTHGVNRHPSPLKPQAIPDETPFIFTAGSLRPARGLDDLVGVLTGVNRHVLPRVAIAGSTEDSAYVGRIKSTLAANAVAGDVLWLGGLSASEMAWCFRNARLFVMTSRAEACPNTVLEAMAEGCLSVSTDQPPMPEFFEDAALYYRRGDPADLSRAINTALALGTDAEATFRGKAVERSTRFSWDATVEATVRELQLAVESSPYARS